MNHVKELVLENKETTIRGFTNMLGMLLWSVQIENKLKSYVWGTGLSTMTTYRLSPLWLCVDFWLKIKLLLAFPKTQGGVKKMKKIQ